MICIAATSRLSIYAAAQRGLAQILRQEGGEQGRQQECINLISRLLRRKLGIHPEIDQAFKILINLSVETLESMTDALLDFNEIEDLKKWISQHRTEFF